MNFGELTQLVSYWLDDLQLTYFTPAQVHTWLNNAQYECQKSLILAGQNYYTICSTTPLNVNQQDYVLPDNFMKLQRLDVIVSGTPPNENYNRIIPITPSQENAVLATTGCPQGYFFKKNRLRVTPAPDQSTYTMRMYYSYRVLPMVLDVDIPDIPLEYHEYLAVLATLDGLFKDGRDPSPMLEKKRYYLDLMKSEAAERNIDQSRNVVLSGAYDTATEWW